MIDECKCPYCGYRDDYCAFPDLFYEGDYTQKKQYKLLKEIQNLGYNVITCGMCGEVFIVRT